MLNHRLLTNVRGHNEVNTKYHMHYPLHNMVSARTNPLAHKWYNRLLHKWTLIKHQ